MHIIFDFDYTLFDTHAMRQAFLTTLRDAYGTTEQEYYAAEAAAIKKRGVYRLTDHLAELYSDAALQIEARQKIDSVMHSAQIFLYPDVLPVLSVLHEHGHQLSILSFGDTEFQQYKITHAGLEKYISHVEVVETKKTDAKIFMNTEVVYVNDRATEIDALQPLFPSVTFLWITRKNAPYIEEKPTVPHVHIESFTALTDAEKTW